MPHFIASVKIQLSKCDITKGIKKLRKTTYKKMFCACPQNFRLHTYSRATIFFKVRYNERLFFYIIYL